ncbi:hypothetical protein [Streptomyces sp. NPDC053048]|uniref:hypothetical protein n=1 Tax=Streptomyces sp. NPDC053048 TaxID=3365694 RepID=UPI0037D26FD5
MIHLSETLALQTVEDFLTCDELAQLTKIMDAEHAATGWKPTHQADVVPAPPLAQEILHSATARALPALRRALPSVVADATWDYTELTAGQEIRAHIDGIADPGTPPRRIGRLGVVLADAEDGGDFYIATTSHPAIWSGTTVGEAEGFAPGTPLTHRLPHVHDHGAVPEWLRDTPRTRWTADAPAGTGIAYGAQVVHGVLPVRAGRLRKFVTDLIDTRPPHNG